MYSRLPPLKNISPVLFEGRGGCSRATKPRGIIPQYNASVNSSCAQPPPPLPLGVYPQALAFFALDGKSRQGLGLLSCQMPLVGDAKRGQMPHPPSTQSSSAIFNILNILMCYFLFHLMSAFLIKTSRREDTSLWF